MDFELSEEHLAFQDMVHKWVDKEAPKSWARELERDEHNYPFALWEKFTDAGFHGVGIAEEFGGQGGDVVMQMILGRELARSLAGLAWIWGITSFAGSKSIGIYGSESQKQKFLPQIAAGKLRAAIAFTEPGGGTDVLGALRTEAVRGDGGWILNGEKIWSSSAHVADYLLVLGRTDKNVAKRHQGVTLFWVPAKSPGVKITSLPKLGMRSMGSCAVHFENVFVPDDLVLGEPGRAWYMLLPTLNNERIMVAAFCMGVLDGVLEDHRRIPNTAALRCGHGDLAAGGPPDAALHGGSAIEGQAVPHGIEHAQGACIGVRRERRGSGHTNPGRYGLFGRNGYAALLARCTPVAHRTHHQRDGAQRHRRRIGTAALVLTRARHRAFLVPLSRRPTML
jgi:alkylation response protein AidB-like acyl-CoA dehydrogenase